MIYPDLANSTSAMIRADFLAAGLSITSNTETYLAELEARTRCWKGIFAATAAWLTSASAQEQSVAWQSIIKICNKDGRPLAAMSRMFYFQNNAGALRTLWQSLPSGTLSDLQVALASNPLLLAMFSDSNSGVVGLPSVLANPAQATSIWAKVQHKMTKLSRFENPGST